VKRCAGLVETLDPCVQTSYGLRMILTCRYRVKGKSAAKALTRMARAVNTVLNFCGGAQEHARRWNRRRPSGFDLVNLTSGSSRELGLHSDTVQAVCKQFAISRNKAKRRPRWRGRKSLGWVPFQAARAIRLDGDTAVFLGRRFRLWYSRPVAGEIKCGCFAQDAAGHWFLNLQIEVEERTDCGVGEIGVDLGLSTLATLSTGEKIENPRHLRRHEVALAKAQRAGRKKRARAIHAKIKNARRHHLHQITTRLVRENRRIVVGDVSAAKLARTRMAKSVLDAGWSTLRHQLRYKAIGHGAEYVEADERWSSQVCSACYARSGPRGLKDLGVREWDCSECGTVHDRDTNSALLILLSGRNAGLQATEILGL
jgi:IS605 OrfB family transposase